jgi:hypothetical protein
MKVFRYIRTVVGFQQEFGAVLDVPAVVLQSCLNALQTNAVPYVALFPSPLILEALKPLYSSGEKLPAVPRPS